MFKSGLAALALASVATPVLAGFNLASSNNVAVYWGQNSYGQAAGPLAQQRLAEYCANSDIDIIPISFLIGITTPLVNFANQEAYCSPIPGSSLPPIQDSHLTHHRQDIKTCQNAYGKTILLSLGGATTPDNGFSSSAEAASNADEIWSYFGPCAASSSVPRPFGNAVIDGFDFDFEATVSNLPSFAQRLQANADAATAAGDKHYIFIAAPQCPFPDQAVGPMLGGGPWNLASMVSFDAIFVQFYNNYCGNLAFVPGSAVQSTYNFAQWDFWARTISKNPKVKVFMGIPGNIGAGAGYVPASAVVEMIAYNKQFASFGGVMIWEATQAYSNPGFLNTIKNALGGSTAAGPVSTSAIPSITPIAKPTPTTSQISTADPVLVAEPNPGSQSEAPASTTGFHVAEVAPVNTEAAPTTFQTAVIANAPLPVTYSAPTIFKTVTITNTPQATTQTPEYKCIAPNTLGLEAMLTAQAIFGASSEIAAPPTTFTEITITEVVSQVTRTSTFYAVSTTGTVIESSSETLVPTTITTQVLFQTPLSTPAGTLVSAAERVDLVSEWNQCGGIGYSGPTECEDGLVYTRDGSDWWYSCKQPGS